MTSFARLLSSAAYASRNAGNAWRAATAVRLRDGAVVSLRETRGDTRRLGELFYSLSDTSRYLYFCAGVPRNEIWAERVARLGTADGWTSYALLAEAAGTLVGVARFDRDAHSSHAEIGLLLTDAWQSRGLGREVITRLRAEALDRSVTGFTATVLGENYRALRLLRRAFPTMRATWSGGQGTLELPFESVLQAPASPREGAC